MYMPHTAISHGKKGLHGMVRWIPCMILLAAIGLFTVFAWWMNATPNQPTLSLPRPDPTRIGSSVQAVEVAQEQKGPTMKAVETENVVKEATPVKTPAPLFWMALGAMGTSIGILVATREKKRYLYR